MEGDSEMLITCTPRALLLGRLWQKSHGRLDL